MDLSAPAAMLPGWPRRVLGPAALGLIGVASLLLQPLPAELAQRLAHAQALPPWAVRALLALNPALLTLLAALAGALAAHRVGLVSLAAGTASRAGAWASLAACAAGGFVLGVAIGAADGWLAPFLGVEWQAAMSAAGGAASRSLAAFVVGLSYGGLAEEVLLRWGAMSLLAWALVRVLGARRRRLAMGAAIAASALLFAVAHLPALAAQVELTAPVVLRTLVLNAAAGAVYGWLFWRRHLEAAMAAHAASHVGLLAWRAWTA